MGVLESMSYGKPVLATDIGGIPGKFMQSGKTGYLFNVGDVSSFAKKLLELSKTPQTTKLLGHNASLRALNGFSSKVIVLRVTLEYI